jgi:hypothetical protein
MKQFTIHSLILLIPLILVGCAPSSSTMQPPQEIQSPNPTHLLESNTISPTYTFIPVISELPLPTTTHPPFTTLDPETVIKTMQPLLEDPFNCSTPCFMGITPGKTTIEQVKAFYGPLGFRQREGKANIYTDKQYYSVGYEDVIKRDSNVTFLYSNSLIENIEITPDIPKQKEGAPREWTAYSPETLIRKYGQPSRVEFAIDWGPSLTLSMILFYDKLDLIALYSGSGMFQGHPNSPRLCPLTAPFDYISLFLGPKSGNPPLFTSVPLEKATSLTIDQFTQLLIQNPRDACITLNGDALQ